MKVKILILTTIFFINGCSGSDSSTGVITTGLESRYKLVYMFNANRYEGHVMRWPSTTIKLHDFPDIKYTSDAIDAWSFNFQFEKGSGDIEWGGWATDMPNYCGKAQWRMSKDSEGYLIKSCLIRLNGACRTLSNTMIHEFGHCLGVFNHTANGSVMDPVSAYSPVISSDIKTMIKTLYELPRDMQLTESGEASFKKDIFIPEKDEIF